jgi:hypothetical protein
MKYAETRPSLAVFVLGGLEPKIADVQWLKPKGSPDTVTLWDASQTTGHTPRPLRRTRDGLDGKHLRTA